MDQQRFAKKKQASKRVGLLSVVGVVVSLAPISGGCPGLSGKHSGEIIVDGSSTVFPISEAMAEEFMRDNSGARVTVGTSGTGGGFKKFCNGETDISNASRPIKDSEVEMCAEKGVDFIELEVALDGLSVTVNSDNDIFQCLTVDQLNRAWEPGSSVTTWQDIESDWPDDEIEFYGPGPDSGTFDYFTDTVNGEVGATRNDFQASEDDNVLVQGIAGDKGSLGYFGFAYYTENADKLKIVAIDGGEGCVVPTPETIRNGEYAPLSRPLYMYVRTDALKRPEIAAFTRYHLDFADLLVPDVGYVPLATYEPEYATLDEALAKFAPAPEEQTADVGGGF